MSQTIFAPATGAGRQAIAVVRMSGPDVEAVLTAIAVPLPAPRRAALRTLVDPRSGAALDRALVLYFPAPASYTGEPCAEFHLHGGRAVLAAVLAALGAMPGCRPAEAGEFTRRAFLSGRMTLSDVEGVADLVEAESEAQRVLALRQAMGGLRVFADEVRVTLLEAMSLVEATIDFADDDAGVEGAAGMVRRHLAALVARLDAQITGVHAVEMLRDGVLVVIAGPPNAGKSSLLNALAHRDAAIVSAVPGTTRDLVEVDLDIEGVRFRIVDTAGLRATVDPIEKLGIDRATRRTAEADIVLWLGEEESSAVARGLVWVVRSKADTMPVAAGGDHVVSAVTRQGIADLEQALAGFGRELVARSAPVVLTRERHAAVLRDVRGHLAQCIEAPDLPPELVAEHLRAAATSVAHIVGRVGVEDVLAGIFSRFCIGK